MRAFELISIPVPDGTEPGRRFEADPLFLLRLRAEALLPEVEVVAFEGRFLVRAQHRGHPQLVDLEVTGTDIDGKTWSLLPTGRFHPRSGIHARVGILLSPLGDRNVRLIEGELPTEPQLVELQAILRNPGSQREALFSTASRRSVAKILPTRR